jgi:hypothetical protein
LRREDHRRVEDDIIGEQLAELVGSAVLEEVMPTWDDVIDHVSDRVIRTSMKDYRPLV